MKTKLFTIILSVVLLISSTITVFANDYDPEKTIIITGDVNNNSVVDIDDARTVLRGATGIIELDDESNEQADINRDGVITTDDARIILCMAAKLEDDTPKVYTEWEVTTPSTCIKQGEAVSYCITDNTVKTKKLPLTGHRTIIAPTCTEGSYCPDCFEFSGPPLGHSIVNGYCERCDTNFSVISYVTINNKRIDFNSNADTLKLNLGEPTEILISELPTEKIFFYVYCDDYTKLTIVTLTESNGVVSVYTTDLSTVLSVNDETVNVDSYAGKDVIATGKYKTRFFIDNLGTGNPYAMMFAEKTTTANNFSQEGTVSTYEKIIFHNANSCRVINGLNPLEYNNEISAVAREHSRDMAERNYFSHHSPEGTKPSERLSAAGINWSACGENICAGYNLVYDFNDAWYNSEGHRKIMLTPFYTALGVGVYYKFDSDYRYYSTQNYVNIKS